MRREKRGAHPRLQEVEVRVWCSGMIHTIRYTATGRIRLEDHARAEVRAERAFAALGGEPCGCVQVLQAWRNAMRDINALRRLPPQLQNVRKQTMIIGESRRRKVAFLEQRDRLRWDVETRVEMRLESLMQALVANAGWCGFDHASTLVLPEPEVSSIRIRNNLLVIRMPRRWIRLYRKGAALVNGALVIDLLEERPDGSLLVLAVRQEQGRPEGHLENGTYEIKTHRALLRHEGHWTLIWECETGGQQGEVIPDALECRMARKHVQRPKAFR